MNKKSKIIRTYIRGGVNANKRKISYENPLYASLISFEKV